MNVIEKSDDNYNPFVIAHCRNSNSLVEKFNEYNKIYFDSTLLRFKVRLCSKPKNFGHEVAGYCSSRKATIFIRDGLGEKSVLQTLVHEMIHAKLSEAKISHEDKAHGRAFVRELKRLRALGAPLSPLDVDNKEATSTLGSSFSKREVKKLIRECKVVERISKNHVPKFLERKLRVPFSVIDQRTCAKHFILETYGQTKKNIKSL